MSSLRVIEKEKKSLPKGAKITRKRTDVTIEEIENGFLMTKNEDIDYTLNGENKYYYHSKKYFMKDNPVSEKIDEIAEKSLADNFN